MLGLSPRGPLDPAFKKVPFEEWLAAGDQTRMQWSARVSMAGLSAHQRLFARVEVKLDGAEVNQRRGKGLIVIFVQFRDAQGHVYQDHGLVELDKLGEDLKKADVTYTQSAFVLPGDYEVALAVLHTATGEHSVRREKLHVPPLKNDSLPGIWRDLPAVEFPADPQTPDSWYLPSIGGRLQIPLPAPQDTRIDLVMNLSPSEETGNGLRAQNRNLGGLLPMLKTLSQIAVERGSLHVTMLDPARQRVAYQQEDVRELDWAKMRESLEETNPGKIDVKALAKRNHNAEFLLTEIQGKTGPQEGARPKHAVIVLSGPLAFESGQDVRALRQQPAPGCRVYYIRYREPAPVRFLPGGPGFGGPGFGGRGMGAGPMLSRSRPEIDQLERLLKPLAPRVFDVQTPEQFRKALSTMLAEIAAL